MNPNKSYRDMSTREFIAAVAMHGIYASGKWDNAKPPLFPHEVADVSCRIADALIEFLNQPKEQS